MQNVKPEWIDKAIVWMFALYPGAAVTSATYDAWWHYLKDIREDALRQAFLDAPKSSPKFCPTAPMIREIAEALSKTKKSVLPSYDRPCLPEEQIDESKINPEMLEMVERLKKMKGM